MAPPKKAGSKAAAAKPAKVPAKPAEPVPEPKKLAQPVPRPKAPSVAAEEGDFPRGGAVGLTPLEYRATKRQAEADFLFEARYLTPPTSGTGAQLTNGIGSSTGCGGQTESAAREGGAGKRRRPVAPAGSDDDDEDDAVEALGTAGLSLQERVALRRTKKKQHADILRFKVRSRIPPALCCSAPGALN